MTFCSNCGSKVADGAKFCQKCGVSTNGASSNHESQRQQEYAGKSYKCPNCGEILKSFVTNCPSCGFELRGTKATSAVREFAVKLEAIEAHREHTKPAGMFDYRHLLEISKTDQQKINLIQNFSFPNTKEDMLEFMILATSNIDTSTLIGDGKVTEKALSKAWDSKIKQVYAKAKNSYIDDPDFSKIQDLYDSYRVDINKHKKKNVIVWIGIIGFFLLIFIGPFILIANSEKNDNKKEETRLESIVIEVDDALGNGEYKRALMNAELMEYNGYNKDRDSYWNVRQRYLIEEILYEAEEHGVELEYIPSEEIDNSNKDSSQEKVSDGFVEGFKEGLQPRLDSVKEIINDEESTNRDYIGINSQSNSVDGKSNTVDKNDTSNYDFTIEKGSEYAYMSDEWNVYIASAISDSVIKIEHWGKTLSTSKSVKYKSDIGTYKINDQENGFSWVDDEHTAFVLKLQDKNNSRINQPTSVIFTININDGDKNKGSNYDSKIICYSFQNDDWHFYRVIPLTETIMKIECWYRGNKLGEFLYGYDMGVIDLSDTDTDFEWTDDGHTAFTITMQDSANSNLKKPTFIAFTMENEKYAYMNVKSYMNNKK